MPVSRRSFFDLVFGAGAVAAAQGLGLKAQQKPAGRSGGDGAGPPHGHLGRGQVLPVLHRVSKVSIVKGKTGGEHLRRAGGHRRPDPAGPSG